MEPGDRVSANVELLRPLGEGGMGSVWIARHTSLGVEVAVKFIAKDLATNPAFVARFQREASAAAKVKSPHIVQIFDHGTTPDGTPFIVMELLEGEELATKLRRLGRLPVAEVVQIVRQMAKALAKAHQAEIVHRDLKPANVFLVGTDEEDVFAKILDFGIARERGAAVSSVTDTGVVLGTPYYMSPEQFMNAKHVDLCADLWSIAVMTYECLTGELPFVGESYGEMVLVVNEAKFRLIRELNPSLPVGLDAWFAKAFARNKDARFQSARELADALLAAVPRDQHSLRPGAPLPIETTGEFPVVIVHAPSSTRDFATVNVDGGTLSEPKPATSAVHRAPMTADGTSRATSAADTAPPKESSSKRMLVLVAGLGVVALLGGAAFIRSSVGTPPTAVAPRESEPPPSGAAPTASAPPAPALAVTASTSAVAVVAASASGAATSRPASATAAPATAKPVLRATATPEPSTPPPRKTTPLPKDRGF